MKLRLSAIHQRIPLFTRQQTVKQLSTIARPSCSPLRDDLLSSRGYWTQNADEEQTLVPSKWSRHQLRYFSSGNIVQSSVRVRASSDKEYNSYGFNFPEEGNWFVKVVLVFSLFCYGSVSAMCKNGDQKDTDTNNDHSKQELHRLYYGPNKCHCNCSCKNDNTAKCSYLYVKEEDLYSDIFVPISNSQKSNSLPSKQDEHMSNNTKISLATENAVDIQSSHSKSCQSETSDSGTVTPNIQEIPDLDTSPFVNFYNLDGSSFNGLKTNESLEAAKHEAGAILTQKLIGAGAPGACVAVAVDGVIVWTEGFGTCDVQSGAICSPEYVYRIASISKPLTAILAMLLVELGMLDLDAPIRNYLPQWPVKHVQGEEVEITTRHLLSHTSGIRHYHLKRPKQADNSAAPNDCGTLKKKLGGSSKLNRSGENESSESSTSNEKLTQEEVFLKHVRERRRMLKPFLNHKIFDDNAARKKRRMRNQSDLHENYINQAFESTQEAVKLFQDDELFFKPGSDFLYSSHAYTLLSWVLEAISKNKFPYLAEALFGDLGMTSTRLDKPEDIVIHRAPCYDRDHQHLLRNAPYVNNSYKWAGGGFLSSAVDLLNFGNMMLYSLQTTQHMIDEHGAEPGYLKSATVQQMWSPHFYSKKGEAQVVGQRRGYGLGWCVQVPAQMSQSSDSRKRFCSCSGFVAYHTGGAVGGSSVLMVVPTNCGQWRIEDLPDMEDVEDVESVDKADKISSKYSTNDTEKQQQLKAVTEGADLKKKKVHSICKLQDSAEDCSSCRAVKAGADNLSPGSSDHTSAGVVVTILTNYSGINFTKEALQIAHSFKGLQ